MTFRTIFCLAIASVAVAGCEPVPMAATTTTTVAANTSTGAAATTTTTTTTSAPVGGFVTTMSPNVTITPISQCAAAVQAQTSKVISVKGSQPVTGGALVYIEAGGNNPERWICRNMGGQITITAV